MQQAIDFANGVLRDYKKAQTDLESQIKGLIPVIDQLTSALAAQYTVLTKADAAFKNAVEQLKGCTFASLLNLVKTIVGVGKDVMDAWEKPTAKSVVTVISDFYGLFDGIQTGKIIQDPKAISGDPDAVAKAWNTIYPSGTGDVADDKKLVVLQKEFDDALKPYLGLPEAKEYQKQLHDYIGIAQSRNAKLLDYTNACVQYVIIIGKIAQKEEEVKRIQKQIAQENVPGLITYRNFLYSLYQDFKSMCLKYLYQENRAYIYWSQGDSSFDIVENSFNGLGLFHTGIQQKIIDRINAVNTPDQPIMDLKILLTAAGREEQFKAFRETRTFTFQITKDDDHFLGWANVLLTNFRIYIKGAVLASNGNLYVQLVHQGSVIMIDRADKIHDYTHNQVKSTYQYSFKDGHEFTVGGGSMGGDTTGSNPKRIALSPYTTFTISVPEKYNPESNLDKAEQIEIHFSGYAVQPLKSSLRVRK
jgi:hypothetical protein